MRESPKKLDPPQFLTGWKEIANYLGKGVRTVQRYERQLGLPVRRPAGKPSGSVVATKAELDGWVSASPIREVYHLTNPFPVHNSETDAIKRGVSEMHRLREQTFALRAEVAKTLEILRQSVDEIARGISRNSWDNRAVQQHSSLYAGEERELVDKNQLLPAPKKHPKAS